MKNQKTKTDYYNKKEVRIIYVLLSPTEKNVYINHCARNALKETYRHNLKCRRASSKNFIEKIQPQRPCVFILETVFTTSAEANNYVLVWIKIFLENGYSVHNSSRLKNQITGLYHYNQKIYNQRKCLNVENFLSCKTCFLPTYKKQTCEKYKLIKREMEKEK